MGVQISCLKVDANITSIAFSTNAQLLIGDDTGRIIGVRYNEGSMVVSAVCNVKMRLAPTFHERGKLDSLKDCTSLQRNITALTVIPCNESKICILGFDNGDVQCYDDRMMSVLIEYGWHFTDEPIVSIGYKRNFHLARSHWSDLDDATADVPASIYVHTKNNAAVHDLKSNLSLYLDGIESEIRNIVFMELRCQPCIVVISEYMVYIYDAVQFQHTDTDIYKALHPAKTFTLALGGRLTKAVEIGINAFLAADSSGELWRIELDAEKVVVQEHEAHSVAANLEVVDLVSKQLR